MLIGCLWGRTADKDALAAQRTALADAGCERVVEDLFSKRRGEQTELHRVLDNLQAGDVVVVPALGSLGRSLLDVARRVEQIATTGASLRSLKEGIDTAAPEGRVALGVIGSLIGLAQDTMRGRGRSWPAVQPVRGRKAGRRPKLNEQQRAVVVQAVLSKRETAATMARRYRVSEATVSRVVAAYRAVGDAAAGSRAVLEATSVNGVLSFLRSGGVNFPTSLRLVASVTTGRLRVGEHCEVEVDDGFERFGRRAVAQAFRQCVEPGGILGL